jgi:hypothetical protein
VLIKLNNYLILNKKVFFGVALLIIISFSLQWEYSAKTRLMWNQVRALGIETGLKSQINLNDTYTNYIITQEQNDFTGLIERRSFDTKCYVSDYTLGPDTNAFRWIESLEEAIDENLIKKAEPYDSKKKKGIPRAKNNLDRMIYNEKYFSVLYDFVGKDAYVGTWCVAGD